MLEDLTLKNEQTTMIKINKDYRLGMERGLGISLAKAREHKKTNNVTLKVYTSAQMHNILKKKHRI